MMPYYQWIGDDWCDLACLTPQCQYDMLDCCFSASGEQCDEQGMLGNGICDVDIDVHLIQWGWGLALVAYPNVGRSVLGYIEADFCN